MKPPIENVIDTAAITIASRIHGALRLYSPFIYISIGLSDQATGSCAERHRKSVDKCLRVLKKVRYVLVVVASMLCVGRSSLAADWLIVPGVRVGSITTDTSETDLKKTYGESEVVAADIDVGEGQTQAGTILFPRQTAKVLTLFWTDETRTHVAQVRINTEGTNWRTNRGITIGTPLRAIEQLNGRPVNLAGFGWDYSGTILDCDGGALKELGVQTPTGTHGRTLLIRVAPQSKWNGSTEYSRVLGDRTFKSDHAAMRKLNPTVYIMIVDLR